MQVSKIVEKSRFVIAALAVAGSFAPILATAETQPHQSPVLTYNTDALKAARFNRRDAVLMLDYQQLKIPGTNGIDLLGYHLMSPINDWLSIGLGSYAPVLQGEYGGFMGFGVIAHAQRNLTERLFVQGGLSFGGGGGGRSIGTSAALSGTGGFAKGYLGLGYRFNKLSVGVNVSKFKFFKSPIDSTQANLFVQLPFTYGTGPYHQAGKKFTLGPRDGSLRGRESIISFGLDNFKQINPTGSFKDTLHTVDVQYSRFFNDHLYGFFALGVGYKGLPIYNQAIGGLGLRYALSERINLYGQLGIGSGGYAPSLIDTGSGQLIYPKLSAEYMLNDRFGVALTAGYMFAPDGTSKNYSLGLALNTHFNTPSGIQDPDTPETGRFGGYRLSLTHTTKTAMTVKAGAHDDLNLLNLQLDRKLTDHLYIPIRAGISYESYRGYPGYGEISLGLGLQTRETQNNPWRFFGELQLGANVEGPIIRPGVGVSYALNDAIAIRGVASHTVGTKNFKSTNLELGLTYRFSAPRFGNKR